MLCDSTSPLLKNVSVKMPESLRKLISRMHSARNCRLLASNALPVKKQNAKEKKIGVKKLCGLMKPKRKRISLRHSASSMDLENGTPSQVYDNSALFKNSPLLHQPSVNSEKSLIDSSQNDIGIPLKPLAESTNTPKITANRNEISGCPAPRQNSFTYPSELIAETDTDCENIAVKFKPSDNADQDSNFLVKNTKYNVEPADYENVKPNDDNSGIDSTVVITNEDFPINRNAITPGNVSVSPSCRQTVHETAILRTPVNNPPLDDTVIRSSLKTRNYSIKKWVTFNNIVQAESQTRFINDSSVESLKTNNSKPEKMQIDIQPISVDDFYTRQSPCTQANNTTSEFTQISSQTNFVDDLYSDSPITYDTKPENEDINSSAGNKMQNMMSALRRINNNITKATSDISKMSLFFEGYKDCS